jgi:putative Mn2+ efflux pump MntP
VIQLLTGLLPVAEKVLDRVIPDPKAKQKAIEALKELDQKGELAKIEAEFADKQSAREREMKIANSEFAPMLNKIVTPILALGTVILAFGLFLVIIFVDVNPQSKDILIYVLGTLSSAVTMVLGYYFGSSLSSKDKTKELSDLMDRKEPKI